MQNTGRDGDAYDAMFPSGDDACCANTHNADAAAIVIANVHGVMRQIGNLSSNAALHFVGKEMCCESQDQVQICLREEASSGKSSSEFILPLSEAQGTDSPNTKILTNEVWLQYFHPKTEKEDNKCQY